MTSVAEWRVPGYTHLKVLGAGGQGRVVLARGNHTGEVVAIKYLAAELLGDAQAVARFRAEAEMLVRVRHPNVTRLREFVELDGGSAIVMEAVHGQSLRKVMDSRGAFEPEAALAVLKGSLLGMAAAHAVGVVHRDYKPANVMVRDDGQSKLIDFGIAGLVGERRRMGTPAYMAPEQWRGGPATAATDIYSATCVFFECVTGRRPFEAGTLAEWTTQHTTGEIPLERLQDPLHALVMQGMAKDPGQRFSDAAGFVRALEVVAATAYGADWERRGWLALGGAVAVFASAFPAAMLGGSVVGPTAQGTVAIAKTAAGVGRKGLFGKVGGTKGAVGAGAAVTGVAVTAVLLWPSAEATVGGVSDGTYSAYFTRPGVVLANATVPDGATTASPGYRLALKLSPARAKPGTSVTLTAQSHARAPWGLEYLGPNHFRCHEPNSERTDPLHQGYAVGLGDAGSKEIRVWLYPVGKKAAGMPTSKPIKLKSTRHKGKRTRKYDNAGCSWTFDSTDTDTFVIPPASALKPGRYQVCTNNPPGLISISTTVNGRRTEVSPAHVGAQTAGTLPVLTVLKK
ncbi:serine/threonine protein kinase [Actinomadura barringtoniae]|uniref:non-specific serine/threonine protein kinase n=1 Tax=Actinomadura barringtoniae TaxID=1427535 RepID=A0A939PT20_9ACTN|nr:serine/threonine-protein kinase [Actinomadura barringtoniae]MBO2454564.1 serine/threonine protein kinase [Actinomadura barringtoniae]